jgi:hypothetical protein
MFDRRSSRAQENKEVVEMERESLIDRATRDKDEESYSENLLSAA